LAGCGGTVVDVGSDKPPIGVDAGSGDGLEGWPSDAVCRRGTQLPIVGAWEGYMEDRNLTPNSDVIKLVITAANDTAVCGTFTFGTATPPVPPTDATNGLPPGVTPPFQGGLRREEFEGLPLTVLQGKATLPRLTFQATVLEFWKTWCELQTPYPVEGQSPPMWLCKPTQANTALGMLPDGGCVTWPNGAGMDAGTPIACDLAFLCGAPAPCRCTEERCAVPTTGDIKFDVTVFDNEMHGSGANTTVHLTKAR